MDTSWEKVVGLAVAALGGAAVGVDRQRKGDEFAGMRTFTLLGGLAGAAGMLWADYAPLATVLLAGAVGLVVAAYMRVNRTDAGGTTEVWGGGGGGGGGGWGEWKLASGMIAVTSVLLAEKSRLHGWAERLPEEGLRSGFRFGLMALVVLPLLPEGPFGPWGGVKPRELWIVVLLISGLNFLGYAARAMVGPGKGAVLSGLLGGLVSSTNVTLSLARTNQTAAGALGVITACTVMYVRVGVATAILNPTLAWAVLPYVAVPAAVGAGFAGWGLYRDKAAGGTAETGENPLQVGAALQMAGLFQAVLFGLRWAREWWGGAGLVVSGAVLGLTDVDALTIAMAKAQTEVGTAALAVAVGCVANTVVKLGISLVVGRGEFRRSAVFGFVALLVGSGLGILLGR
ncbi:MAG: DUF4010 domain-containing protein [Acidobacteria bacterium]|nr:DUF4010 domain-containing protein [Acidobacteriota bacterium]